MTVIEEQDELLFELNEHLEKILRCAGKMMNMLSEYRESSDAARYKKYNYDEYLKNHKF